MVSEGFYRSPRRSHTVRGLSHVEKSSSRSRQTLHLWVEHGLNISARSAIVISKFNGYHATAKQQQLNASVRRAVPSLEPSQVHRLQITAESTASRLTVQRDVRERDAVRSLRTQKTQQIAQREKIIRLEREKVLAEKVVAEHRARAQLQASEAAAKARKEAALAQDEQTKKTTPNRTNHPPDKSSHAVSFAGTPLVGTSLGDAPGRVEAPIQAKLDFAKNGDVQSIEPVKPKPETAAIGGKEENPPLLHVQTALKTWKDVSAEANAFRQNPSMKKVRLTIKKQVNLAVNQIAASVKQVSGKVRDLCRVLRDTKRMGGSAGEAFAMKEVAERLVNESDGTVALSKTTAFAVAAVIVGVAATAEQVEKMRDVIFAAFFNHCMYTMPRYTRRKRSETIDDYRSRIGYKDGEEAESYLERMCGCVNLFGAVVQCEQVYTGSSSAREVRNPFSLDYGWSWLARVVNIEQHSITPAIVYAFLETAGYPMAKRYRRQFAKLMAIIQKTVVLKAHSAAPKGPTSRLDIFIDEYVSAGCVIRNAPEGRILPVTDAEFM